MESKKTRIFINCEQAAHICDKSQYNESTWWERLRLNLRFIYCSITRAYVKRNKKLTAMVKDAQCMDSVAKENLRKAFDKHLK